MSIVGTQAVSMSDLMKLGVPALNAMAQGQAKTIAPSYMVIAALKALTDQQKGMSSPVPQATVKDQVVAQAQPAPMQAGIGQMRPPVQKFSVGGTPERQSEFDDPDWTLFDLRTDAQKAAVRSDGPFFDLRSQEQKDAQRRARYPQSDVEGGRGRVTPFSVPATQATDPTARVGTEKGRATNTNPFAPPRSGAAPQMPDSMSASVSSSARSRGVGGAGTNPLAKYAELGKMPTADSFKLDIPKNERLEAAAAKFSKPDAERMAELRAAEENAGLSAFARGMVDPKRGRGFGAVFGAAAADYNDTKEARADKRREYEDKREALATQLGIQVGDNARQDFLKQSEWGAARAEKAFDQGIQALRARNEATHFGNQEILKAREIEAHLAAVSEQAATRKDNNLLQRVAMISQQRTALSEKAKAAVYDKYKQMPTFGMDPTLQRRADYEANSAAQAAEAKYLISVAPLLKQLGVPVE